MGACGCIPGPPIRFLASGCVTLMWQRACVAALRICIGPASESWHHRYRDTFVCLDWLCFFVPARPALSTFLDLGVHPALANSLQRGGFHAPFPIQHATLPDAIGGRDVLGRGQTGSGKTLAFGLAMLTRLAGRTAGRGAPLGLILVPTRELAMQVSDALSPHADHVGLRVRVIAGGMPYKKQIDALRNGVQILVATPGRLMDLIEKGEADLSDVSITVLDEADQMADLGFLPIVKEILNFTRRKSQRLLFSATLDRGVDALVRDYLRDAVEHATAPAQAAVDTMNHHVLMVHPLDKDVVTAQIAARKGRTIFFVRTQAGAEALADRLAKQGIAVGALHGGKTQAVRTRTLKAFKDGVTTALVATDVAARGIHVDDISLVVNVDAPADHKDYLHRAGRTARAGESGTVVMLTNPRHQAQIKSLTTRAGVAPEFTRVRPASPELVALTGSREPSGVPWVMPTTRPAGRERSGGRDYEARNTRPHRPASKRTKPRHEGANGSSSKRYESTGSGKRYETAGPGKRYESTGSGKRYESAGSSKRFEGGTATTKKRHETGSGSTGPKRRLKSR